MSVNCHDFDSNEFHSSINPAHQTHQTKPSPQVLQTNRDTQTDRHTNRQTDRQTHKQTDKHTQTDKQTDRQTHRQIDRQTDRQTDNLSATADLYFCTLLPHRLFSLLQLIIQRHFLSIHHKVTYSPTCLMVISPSQHFNISTKLVKFLHH